MSGVPIEVLTLVKEYGLAGVLAWLFWWTLRRMMTSHDATVCALKDQLDTQAQAACATGERFARVVENHMNHVGDSLARFDANLSHQTEDQRRWQDRLLNTMDRLAAYLGKEERL